MADRFAFRYALAWTTVRRRPVLVDAVADRLAAAPAAQCRKLAWDLVVRPDQARLLGGRGSNAPAHLERHEIDFINRGSPAAQVPNAILTGVTTGKIVAIQGTGKCIRKIYEFNYAGRTQRVAVGEGTNGYVVTAHPGKF